MMEHITRERFWTWPEERRSDWSRWFEAHDLSLHDIADFTINEDDAQVEALVYLKDDEGRKYLDGNGVAKEVVMLSASTLDIGGMADQPGDKTKLNLPAYR